MARGDMNAVYKSESEAGDGLEDPFTLKVKPYGVFAKIDSIPNETPQTTNARLTSALYAEAKKHINRRNVREIQIQVANGGGNSSPYFGIISELKHQELTNEESEISKYMRPLVNWGLEKFGRSSIDAPEQEIKGLAYLTVYKRGERHTP